MNWSASQRRLLDALGYEVLALAGAPRVEAMPRSDHVEGGPREAAVDTSRLLASLRRAAAGADPLALAGDLERLRRDPALKRALWPRLRALRRH